ncbi:hypothetical protein ACQKWADRAFT_302637 [Trichoderma austrokoningii]
MVKNKQTDDSEIIRRHQPERQPPCSPHAVAERPTTEPCRFLAAATVQHDVLCDLINLAATLSSAAACPMGAKCPTPSSSTIAAAIRAAAMYVETAGVV